jgi:hypothetical protein
MWQDNESVQKQWVTQGNYDAGNYEDTSGDTAHSYCIALDLGGYDDWRLPTIQEIQTIVDDSRYNPSIDTIFESIQSSGYWSSTSYADDSSRAWRVYFSYGDTNNNNKNNNNYVRCVRAG